MLKSHFKLQFDVEQEEEEEDVEHAAARPRTSEKLKPVTKTGKSRKKAVESDDETQPEELWEEDIIEIPKKEVFDYRGLNSTEICKRLSFLGMTAEGDGYTYLKCSINGMNLTSIKAIKRYKNLMFLDVSQNLLELDALQIITELPYLILIQADDNKLTSAAIKPMKYLQCIIMNNNQIKSVNDVYQPELCTLEVGGNRIETVAFKNRMDKLKVLDFRKNIINDISNFDFPLLDSLYLEGNKLKSLVGLEKLVNLRILHVRNNPIKLLNGFDEALTKLNYINLRSCKVGTLIQVKKLRVLHGLETLILKNCPYMGGTGEEETEVKGEEDDAQLRVEVLAALPRVKRLNKYVLTDEEKEERNNLIKQWAEEGELDEEEIEAEAREEEEHAGIED